jgi:hypothetical protein
MRCGIVCGFRDVWLLIGSFNMSFLAKVIKPPTALIKLIEAIGIIFHVPKSYNKSIYKAPSPSNYDGTITLLLDDYVGCISKLGSFTSSDVSNEVASELYSKVLEPGFDYESAVLAGGLEARDLYNSLILILNLLDSDPYRIPIKCINVMVLCDGSRPSYVAFDLATHIHHHGICYITTLLIAGNDKFNGTIIQTHLTNDLVRRCSEQYHLLASQYQIDILQPHSSDDIIQSIDDTMCEHNCSILIIGIDANYIGTENLSKTAEWAAWKIGFITILVKSITRIRPFTSLKMNRKYLLCVKSNSKLQDLFELCLQIIKPSDYLILCSVVDNGEPLGDTRDGTRYDLGRRARWVAGKVENVNEPNCVGWNKKIVEELEENMRNLLIKSQISGTDPTLTPQLTSSSNVILTRYFCYFICQEKSFCIVTM